MDAAIFERCGSEVRVQVLAESPVNTFPSSDDMEAQSSEITIEFTLTLIEESSYHNFVKAQHKSISML